MRKSIFLPMYFGFLICFSLAIYAWQESSGWVKYVTIGNAVTLFAVQLIMAIYHIGDRR